MPKASTKTSLKKSPVQMPLTAPVKKATKKASTEKPSLPAGRKAPAKASAPSKSFTKVSLPKTALLPAKKTVSKSKRKSEIEKIDEMEHEIKELEKDVADVSYSMSSMLLVIVVVALMALIGYIYSMRAEPVVVTQFESAPEVSVQSENLAPDVIDAVLARISTVAGIQPGDELLSANRVVTAPAGQTYQAGDYIFVFSTKIIVYRAEVNQIVGVASFTEVAPSPTVQ